MQLAFGGFVLDSGRRELLQDGRSLHLSPKAYDLLEALVETRPDAVPKADLLERLWPDTIVVEANLANLVAELRRALGDHPRSPRFIRTLQRFGYAFCAESREVGTEPRRRSRFRLEHLGKAVELREGDNVLGRDHECALSLSSDTVSRRHALIRIAGDQAFLEDLGSKNGTQLAGRPVEGKAPLRDGAEIRLGSVLVVFRAEEAPMITRSLPPSTRS